MHDVTKNMTMNVAVHNPSSLDLNKVSVKIPETGNFDATVFNHSTKKFESVEADKICYDDHLDSELPLKNCRLDIWAKTSAQEITLVKLDAK